MILIAPSLLSADFGRLEEAVRTVERAGADVVHVDVMDGHYVPNLTFGPGLVQALKRTASRPLDVHLMVSDPAEVIPWFIEAGADWISFHAEASLDLRRDTETIRRAGRRAGVALNPGTPLAALDGALADLDFVLLMCVNPGRGSQPFIEASRPRIRDLRRRIDGSGLRALLEIDGGVHPGNAEDLAQDGAEVFVAGNAVFGSPDPAEAVRRLREAARRGGRP